jgi:hypothetical protein
VDYTNDLNATLDIEARHTVRSVLAATPSRSSPT